MGSDAIQSKDVLSRVDCRAIEARYGRHFEMQDLNLVWVRSRPACSVRYS